MPDNKEFRKEMKRVKQELDAESKKVTKRVADMIKTFREKKGMTQREVAKKAGVFQQQFARIESGNYNFTITTLFRIAFAMGATVDIQFKSLEEV